MNILSLLIICRLFVQSIEVEEMNLVYFKRVQLISVLNLTILKAFILPVKEYTYFYLLAEERDCLEISNKFA